MDWMWMTTGLAAAGPGPAEATDYEARVASLATRRVELATRWEGAEPRARQALVEAARSAVYAAVVHELLPAWEGTPWTFEGTSPSPGTGSIACGFYVGTILRDAGFNVDRLALGRLASEHIILKLTPAERVWRQRGTSPLEAVAPALAAPEGLYVAGLDHHTGFVVVENGKASFCDASYVDPVAVTCQPIEDAASFQSTYRVFGSILEDALMVRWLEGKAI